MLVADLSVIHPTAAVPATVHGDVALAELCLHRCSATAVSVFKLHVIVMMLFHLADTIMLLVVTWRYLSLYSSYRNPSLIPRPFPSPVFDCLQYASTEEEDLGDLITYDEIW